jgi:hypothetical protein
MSTTPTAMPAPIPEEAQPPINSLGRIVGALFDPVPTFESIARRPSWIAPIVLMILVGAGMGAMLAQRVNWDQVIGQQLENSPLASRLSAAQRQHQLEVGPERSRIGAYVTGPLSGPIVVLFYSGLLLGAFNLFAGANLSFRQSVAIVAHARLPAVISSILVIAVLALRSPDAPGTFDPQNPLATSLSAVLPAGSAPWLVSLLGSFDLFILWMLVLYAIGFSAANPKKVKLGTAFAIVFGLWAFWVIVKVGATAMATL